MSTRAATQEQEIGVWRRSKKNLGFWGRAIITLGLWILVSYRHNKIVLTTRRVSQYRGNILTSNVTSMSVENITDINVNKSAVGSLLNYGDINIQSAGSGATEISFNAIERPDELREKIFDLRDGKLDETR